MSESLVRCEHENRQVRCKGLEIPSQQESGRFGHREAKDGQGRRQSLCLSHGCGAVCVIQAGVEASATVEKRVKGLRITTSSSIMST